MQITDEQKMEFLNFLTRFLLPGDVITIANQGIDNIEMVVVDVERDYPDVGSPATLMLLEKSRFNTMKKQNPFEMRVGGDKNFVCTFDDITHVGDVEYTLDDNLNYWIKADE